MARHRVWLVRVFLGLAPLLCGSTRGDTVIGVTDPGTTQYRDADMELVGAMTIPAERDFRCSVVDPVSDAVYYGTNTAPGHIVKVGLSTFRCEGTLVLNPGEDALRCAILDPPGHAAYFGTVTRPARIIKVDLDTFTRVGSIQFNPGDDIARTAVYDPAYRMGYFATGISPSRIMKVDLASFRLVGALLLNTGDNDPHCSFIDTTRGLAYFGTLTAPGRLVQVDLATFRRTGLIYLPLGYNGLRAAAYFPTSNTAILGTYTSPAALVKVDLAQMTTTGATVLPTGFDGAISAAPFDGEQHALFGMDTRPGRVVTVTAAGQLEQNLQLPDPEGPLWNADQRPGTDEVWLGDIGYAGTITRLATTGGLRRLAAVSLAAGVAPASQVFEEASGHSAFATASASALPIALLSDSPPRLEGQYTFLGMAPPGRDFPSADVPKGITDYTTQQSTLQVIGLPGAIIDVDVVGLNIQHTWVGDLKISLVDPQGAVVALSTNRGSGGHDFAGTTFDDKATQSISAGSAPFTGSYRPETALSAFNGAPPNGTWTLRVTDSELWDVGTLTGWGLRLATEQTVGLYFHDAERQILYQVDRSGTPTLGAVALQTLTPLPSRPLTGDLADATWGFMKGPTGHAILGDSSVPARLHDVILETLESVATLDLPRSDGAVRFAVPDAAHGKAYLVTDSTPPRLVQVDLPTMSRQGRSSFPSGEPQVGFVDSAHDRVCFTVGGLDDPDGVSIASFSADSLEYQGILASIRVSEPPTFAMALPGGERALLVGPGGATRVNLGYPSFGFLGGAYGVPWLRQNSSELLFTSPGEVRKTGRSPGVRGIRVTVGLGSASVHSLRFATHQSCQKLRLGVYRDAPAPSPLELLWESAEHDEVPADSTLEVAISDGWPEGLVLPEGVYWLAWQVDSANDTPGVATGGSETSFFSPGAFGPFPTRLDSGGLVLGHAAWSESATIGLVQEAPSTFGFEGGAAGWSFHGIPEIVSAFGAWIPPAGDSSGMLGITATDNGGNYGSWESPVMYRGGWPGSGTMALAFHVQGGVADALESPEYRIRVSSERFLQTDMLSASSNPPAAYSPSVARAVSGTMIWSPPATDPAFRICFDLVNFTPEDAATGSVMLDSLSLSVSPTPMAGSQRLEKRFTFEDSREGFRSHGVADMTTPNMFRDSTGGRLAIQTVPFESAQPGALEFGWWGSPENVGDRITQEPGRLYFADFVISTDEADLGQVPTFRLRINDSSFQVAALTVVSSTGNGSNSPSEQRGRSYRVYFPPNIAPPDGWLVFSLDLLSTAGDEDAVGSTIYLDELSIWSVPMP